MRSINNIKYSSFGDDTTLNLHLPEGDFNSLFMYIHGGGIVSGCKDDTPCLFEYLTENGVAAASINYRMYPKAKYPEFLEDAAAAAAWIKNNIAEYGNCKKIYLGGSSAGGYISMMLCFDEKYLGAHGLKPLDFAGFVHDAGQPTAHFNVLAKDMGVDSRRVIIDETAPLYYIGLAENYPPMYFIWSDKDMQNRPEQMELTLSTLKHFGYDQNKIKTTIMNGTHCAYVAALTEDGKSLFGKMVLEFIKEY